MKHTYKYLALLMNQHIYIHRDMFLNKLIHNYYLCQEKYIYTLSKHHHFYQ